MAPDTWARPFEPAAEAVVRLFYPHVEAVIHDVERDVVVRAWNPFSSCEPGDPSLLGRELLGQLAREGISGPYPTAGPRGEELSRVSAMIAGGRGVLCLSFDRSVVTSALAGLAGLAGLGGTGPAAGRGARIQADRRDELSSLVHQWCQEHKTRPGRLSRRDRHGLVAFLDETGAFQVRRAAAHLAAILGVSRATIYSTLQTARGQGASGQEDS
jgi:predicted transcriptional regulator YheO